ncbi:MAG: histidine phosphatase family protein [Kineosporiaceae bacterium]|nr:histidine phosphatase family protein [Kineosporiaceae bacterium]
MDLVLIRHGQSANNALWQRTGSSVGRSPDPELTELGRIQARAVAEALQRKDFDVTPTHLYTSLMTRAVQTAAPIAHALDLPLVAHEEIFEFYGPVEMDPDSFERTPHPGAARQVLAALSDRLMLPESATPAGWWSGPVETEQGCAERGRRVVEHLTAQFGGTDAVVVLVTHGTFSQYLIRALLGADTMTGWLTIENTGVSRFRLLDGFTLASYVNRTSHLLPEQLSE